MTTAFPTEEMTMERGAALVRMAKLQRTEEAKLRKEVDAPIWRDWVFWLGTLMLLSPNRHEGRIESAWLTGIVLLVVALDRVARKRRRAERDLQKLLSDAGKLPQE